MALKGLVGLACLAISLLMGLWMEHLRERPVYRRPAFLIHRGFWLLWGPARWILFGAGWILAGLSFPRTSASLAFILLGLWSWKRHLRSRSRRRRMVREAFDRERARDPAAGDTQILRRIVASLHARWGEELIEQIVVDNPTPEAVADFVVRMERGILPPGFFPSGSRRGRR
jgi:hypothetical protein